MAMDSYMKGVATDVGKQAASVRPAEGAKKTSAEKDSIQKAVVSESSPKKMSVPKSSPKKVSVPKSSPKKASAVKSSAKKASVPRSSTRKALTSDNVQKLSKVRSSDGIQETGNQEEGNMDVLFEMEKEPAISTIESAISSINAQMTKTRCAYAYDEDAKRITIKVYDDETDELIREVPPERSLELLKRVWEKTGIMIDEKF